MNILLVDDEKSILKVLGDFLHDCGYRIRTAANGVLALGELEAHQDFDLIISDVRMPEMDGISFLSAVRVRFPGIPVILITGHGDEELAVEALQEGATDYLKKPVKLAEFLVRIERIEERRVLEQSIIEGHQMLRDPGPKDAQPNAESEWNETDAEEDVETLEGYWSSLREHITNFPPDNLEVRRRLQFILEEGPCLLANVQRKVRRISVGQE